MADIFNMLDTWAASGTVFTGIKLNVTDTASAAGSLLMDLQVGGSSRFSVDKAGGLVVPTKIVSSTVVLTLGVATSGNDIVALQPGAFGVRSGDIIGWSSSASIPSASLDLAIRRDAANTLAQRNGVNAQAFNLYNTYTDASNYERLVLSTPIDSSSNKYVRLSAQSAGTGAVNIGVVLGTLGTGPLVRQLPTGTAAGGNARGAEAVDLQASRSAADQVASGTASFAAGRNNRVSNQDAFALGRDNVVTGGFGALGVANTVSAGFAVGSSCTSSAGGSSGIALIQNAVADKQSQVAVGGWVFTSPTLGQRQHSTLIMSAQTADDTQTETFLAGTQSSLRATIPASTTWVADIDMIARSASGTDNKCFKRRCIIKRNASNVTELVGSVETLGTDIASTGAVLWAIDITADDTNEALKVTVTGSAATSVRWVARVALVEVGYI